MRSHNISHRNPPFSLLNRTWYIALRYASFHSLCDSSSFLLLFDIPNPQIIRADALDIQKKILGITPEETKRLALTSLAFGIKSESCLWGKLPRHTVRAILTYILSIIQSRKKGSSFPSIPPFLPSPASLLVHRMPANLLYSLKTFWCQIIVHSCEDKPQVSMYSL